ETIALRPLTMATPLSPDMARRAVRYGSSVVFFLDERAFPEPSGFWVGGARGTTVVLRADRATAAVTLTLRNGGAPNRVLLESGNWRGDVGFGPGEERRIELPLDPRTGAALV